MEPDQALIKRHKQTLEGRLPVLDEILGKQKYMAGDKLTIVDLFYLPYGNMLAQVGSISSSSPAERKYA